MKKRVAKSWLNHESDSSTEPFIRLYDHPHLVLKLAIRFHKAPQRIGISAHG